MDGKYGRIVIYDHEGREKVYPAGMPIFALIAKDSLSPSGPMGYADALEEQGMDAEAAEVRAFAEEMRRWQRLNPEHVGMPD